MANNYNNSKTAKAVQKTWEKSSSFKTRQCNVEERMNEAWRLKRKGLTYREIAEKLSQETDTDGTPRYGKINKSTIGNDIARSMKERREERGNLIEDYLLVQVSDYEHIKAVMMPDEKHEMESAKVAIAAMARIDKLLDLEPTAKSKVEVSYALLDSAMELMGAGLVEAMNEIGLNAEQSDKLLEAVGKRWQSLQLDARSGSTARN